MRSRAENLVRLADGLRVIARASPRVRAQVQARIDPRQFRRIDEAVATLQDETARAEMSRRGWYDDDGVRQGGLIAFVRHFWHVLEPETPFVDGWPLWAICEHLEAATFGEVRRLLINVPPGFSKSMLTNIWWPAWEWGPMRLTHLRYVAFSYSSTLTERDNQKFRDLITSDDYRRLFPEVVVRNKTTIKVANTRTGWKLASSVGGVGTGERGDRVLCDDLHNVKDAESEVIRSETTRWFAESLSTRVNNPATVFVVIMQRVHAMDTSGVILEKRLPYAYLMIPMHYVWDLQTEADGSPRRTAIGWWDPRWVDPDEAGGIDEAKSQCDGALAWPARFDGPWVAETELAMGPYATAGQFQQQPAPRGGGLFKRAWWQLWAPDDGKFPLLDYVCASLDGAFTKDESNSACALTVWGTFRLPDDTAGASVDEASGQLWHSHTRRRIILIDAWRKHVEFSGPRIEREEAELIEPGMDPAVAKIRNARYRARAMEHWGLIEWVRDTCLRFKVHTLLIEAKASGMSAAAELRNRYGDESYAVRLEPVKGDKYARAVAAQPTFSNLLVYAPDRPWAELVIEEMEVFPRHKYSDLTDSATQAIAHLRALRLADTDEETATAETARVTHRSRPKALYPV